MSGIGRRLRFMRENRKLSLYDVERMTGFHYSTVGKYERGLRRPSIDVLRELARAYEVSVNDIIGEEDEAGSRRSPVDERWIDLLRVRPELGGLLEAAADLDERRLAHLIHFLRPNGDGSAS